MGDNFARLRGLCLLFLLYAFNVTQGDSPDHEPGCDLEAMEEAKEHWKALMKQGPHLITIKMSNIAAFGKSSLN